MSLLTYTSVCKCVPLFILSFSLPLVFLSSLPIGNRRVGPRMSPILLEVSSCYIKDLDVQRHSINYINKVDLNWIGYSISVFAMLPLLHPPSVLGYKHFCCLELSHFQLLMKCFPCLNGSTSMHKLPSCRAKTEIKLLTDGSPATCDEGSQLSISAVPRLGSPLARGIAVHSSHPDDRVPLFVRRRLIWTVSPCGLFESHLLQTSLIIATGKHYTQLDGLTLQPSDVKDIGFTQQPQIKGRILHDFFSSIPPFLQGPFLPDQTDG